MKAQSTLAADGVRRQLLVEVGFILFTASPPPSSPQESFTYKETLPLPVKDNLGLLLEHLGLFGLYLVTYAVTRVLVFLELTRGVGIIMCLVQ